MWIWEREDWPALRWEDDALAGELERLELLRTRIRERCRSVGESAERHQSLQALVRNIAASYAIEGEAVDSDALRSSLGRRLDLRVHDASYVGPVSEALAELVHAVTQGSGLASAPTLETLQRWHRLLFPDEVPHRPARVGAFRPTDQPMFVYGRQRAGKAPLIHFEAPPGDQIPAEMEHFVDWLRTSADDASLPGPVRSGLAHLRLVTIHPWEDGTGRMARAVGDRVLADWDILCARLSPLSLALLNARKEYYSHLESTQRGGLDVTPWLAFYLGALRSAMERALDDLDRVTLRQRFWAAHADKPLLAGQRKLLQRMLSDDETQRFPLGVTARQYCGLAKVSKATATRHLTDLLTLGILQRTEAGGRSTRYVLAPLD